MNEWDGKGSTENREGTECRRRRWEKEKANVRKKGSKNQCQKEGGWEDGVDPPNTAISLLDVTMEDADHDTPSAIQGKRERSCDAAQQRSLSL